jgi:hypothetical protein
MAELRIKTEFLPERCEICHQADCFDASSNHCSRCGGVTDLVKKDIQETSRVAVREIAGYRHRLARRFPRLLAGLWFAIASLIPVISFIMYFLSNRWENPDPLFPFVILPVSTAALWGSTIGSKILNRNLTNSCGKAAMHGLMVSILSYISYSFLLAFIWSLSKERADKFIELFLALMFYGSIIIGWLVAIVGSGAGWLLHKLFSSSPKLPQ